METVPGLFSAAEATQEGGCTPDSKDQDPLSQKASEKIRKRKMPGSLGETLDSTLEPRVSPGRPGRSKGSHNYEWTPETDRILEELCAKYGPAKTKSIMQKKLMEMRGGSGEFKPRPDSLREAVERRMLHLGLATGQKRKPLESRSAKLWTPSETTALLGAVGGNLIDETIEGRTHHTIKAARAKLAGSATQP